jgi:hypothetical protein
LENRDFEKLLNDIEKLWYAYEHMKNRENLRELRCFFGRLKKETKRMMEATEDGNTK